MKKLLLTTALLAAAGSAVAKDLDEVLSCNYETLGGYDNLKAVESARYKGTMTMGPMQAPFTIEFLRPNQVRMEFEVQGMTGIQAYDGETGWAVMPFLGKTTAEEMADDQLKSIKEMAEMDGPLVDWKEKGHAVELKGVEEVEGTEAYAVEVTRADGDATTMYLDTEYCLPFLTKGVREMQGNETSFTSTIGDYKEVGDIVVAHSMIQTFGEGPTAPTQAITIESAEINTGDITPDRFAMPEAPAAEQEAAE